MEIENINNGYYCNHRPEIMPLLPNSPVNILEIGCGAGKFITQINTEGERWGIEPDLLAAKEASKNLSNVLQGTFLEVRDKIPENFFDLVICNDVIEHMPDHDAFFKEINRIITKDGYLIGSVPNVRFYKNLQNLLFKKDWKYVDSGILDQTHLRFFTFRSLERSLKQSGFLIQKINGANSCITGSLSIKGIIRQILLILIMTVSVFSWRDIQYSQITFRCKNT